MSWSKIRVALETALGTVAPSIDTAYENVAFSVKAGVPYQRVNLMPAFVENPAMDNGLRRYHGFLQVLLCYPVGSGPKAATDRAELIEQKFAYGNSFSSGGLAVHIESSPDIRPGFIDEDRWCVPVRVSFYADVYS